MASENSPRTTAADIHILSKKLGMRIIMLVLVCLMINVGHVLDKSVAQ